MQLYSDEKDWDRLVKVVLKLADFVDDDKQKSKYLHTAGRIAWKEMGDAGDASQILARALELDPDNDDVVKDGVEVHAQAANAEALKEALKRQVKIASDVGQSRRRCSRSLTQLAELYLRHFKRLDQAIAVYEGRAGGRTDNVERQEILATLYASIPARSRTRRWRRRRRSWNATRSVPTPTDPPPAPYGSETPGRRVVLLPGALRSRAGRRRRGTLLPPHAEREGRSRRAV